MPQTPPNANDQLDEQLTAYLDGELPPAEARQIEDMLAGNDRARKRLNQLASSWDLLDQLPRASVDENFTRTTVEMVALSTEEDIAQAKIAEPSKQRMRWLAAGVIALLAAGVGFFAMSVLAPNNNDALLENLPVVANLEFYRPIGSIQLLRDLEKANLFTSDPPPMFNFRGRPSGQPGSRAEARTEPRVEPEKNLVTVEPSFEARREFVAKLTAEQKLELRRNLERFLALSSQEQTSLRELDHELNTAPNRDALASIVRRYNDWLLRMLNPAERGMLEDLPADKKVARIQQEKSKKDRFIFTRIKGAKWMDEYARKHERDLLAKLPPPVRDDLEQWKQRRRGDGDRQWGRNPYYELLAYEAWRDPKIELPPVTEEEWKDLFNQLRENKLLLDQLKAAPDDNARMQVVRTWIQTAAFVRDTARANFEQQVEWFKSKLSPDDQKAFEELPEDRKHEWLMQKWMKWMQSGGGGRIGQGFPPRGGREGFSPEDGRRKGPPLFEGEPPDRNGNHPPDGQRRGGQPRSDGPRGEKGPRRDRNGPLGPPPPDLGPRQGFDPPPLPPPDDELPPDRARKDVR